MAKLKLLQNNLGDNMRGGGGGVLMVGAKGLCDGPDDFFAFDGDYVGLVHPEPNRLILPPQTKAQCSAATGHLNPRPQPLSPADGGGQRCPKARSERPKDLPLPRAASNVHPIGGAGHFGPPVEKCDETVAKATLDRRRKSTATFQDKYVLTGKELGKGSTASVNICQDVVTGHEYAVKIIYKSRDERQSKRIYREIKTFQLTNGHPNVCQLIEFFEDVNVYYSIFEKMEGGSLLNQIERKLVFTEAEASLVTRDVACALEFLHNIGIAHRDLKPENVLCKYLHTMIPVKISDFDLASDSELNGSPNYPVNTPELTTPVGSAEFMAPEVVNTYNGQAHHYDKRCDMWSLGVIIYIMHCGYPPFYGQCGATNCGWVRGSFCQGCQDMLFQRIQKGHFDFPDQDWTHISPAAKDLISHLLIKDSRKRFTATDVRNHGWVKFPAPSTVLETPDVLKRTNSTGSLDKFTQNAIAVNRMIQQCYAIHKDILDSGYDYNNGIYQESFMNCEGTGHQYSPNLVLSANHSSCSEEDDDPTPFGSCVEASGSFFLGDRAPPAPKAHSEQASLNSTTPSPLSPLLPQSPKLRLDSGPRYNYNYYFDGLIPENPYYNNSHLPLQGHPYTNLYNPYNLTKEQLEGMYLNYQNPPMAYQVPPHQFSPIFSPKSQGAVYTDPPNVQCSSNAFFPTRNNTPVNHPPPKNHRRNDRAPIPNTMDGPSLASDVTSPQPHPNFSYTDESSFYLVASHFEEGLKERRASVEELEENRANLTAKLSAMAISGETSVGSKKSLKCGGIIGGEKNGDSKSVALHDRTNKMGHKKEFTNKLSQTPIPDYKNGAITNFSAVQDASVHLKMNPQQPRSCSYNSSLASLASYPTFPNYINGMIGGAPALDSTAIPQMAWLLTERLRDLSYPKKATH